MQHLLYVPTPSRLNAFLFAVDNGGLKEICPGVTRGIDRMAIGRVQITASASRVKPHVVVTLTTVFSSFPYVEVVT